MEAAYFNYIGKAQASNHQPAPCHLLPYHMMDVAAVGAQVLSAEPRLLAELAGFLGLPTEKFKALFLFGLLLHDLGKMTASFQSLFTPLGYSSLELPAGVSYDSKRGRHDQLGYDVWKKIVSSSPIPLTDLSEKNRLQFFLGIFWGHHGQPICQRKSIRDTIRLTGNDIQAAAEWVEHCQGLVGSGLPTEPWSDEQFEADLKQVSWLLAGLATYCDWVGSDSDVFHYCDQPMALDRYWEQIAMPRAKLALAKTEVFNELTVKPFPGFKALFTYEPSPLQRYSESVEVTGSPQLFILEDLTGSGKTEAALALAHRLMAAGAGRGLYLGLPTMATSNAMFERIAEHYGRILAGPEGQLPSIVLAHGARELSDLFREAVFSSVEADSAYTPNDETASIHCNQWLSDSRKKALLAPVGVGTIDQVLLSVLPKRHQSLRVLGLYGKVLVLDEVHAADEYMLTLLETVMQLHASQGGSLILLTATLPLVQREKLVHTWQKALGHPVSPLKATSGSDFPLATSVSIERGLNETTLECRPGTSKKLKVNFVHNELDCVDYILAAARNGQCAVWIRNSVDEAVNAYQLIKDRAENPDQVQLFHSRFVLQHRKDKERWVLTHFGKASDQASRSGRILIATQVFQESLDADADVMVSDLCLIDDLVQRAGRLHRHKRDANGNQTETRSSDRKEPELLVLAPKWRSEPDQDWLKGHSANTQYVYQRPGRIWRTMAYLREAKTLRLPEESRSMIEYVYGPDVFIPEALKAAEQEYEGQVRANTNQGHFNTLTLETGYSADSNQAWTEDIVDIGTRLGEESREVVLVRNVDNSYLPYIEASNRAVELSTVKLSGKKRLAALTELSSAAKEAFVQKFPRAKYALVVDVENTPYSDVIGWSEEVE